MKIYPSIIIAAVMAACVTSVFAQGTVVFNNGTGLVKQWNPSTGEIIPVPKGGGEVQLFWASAGTPYTPWKDAIPSEWYAANPGWSLGPVTGFTTPTAGKFTGGTLTLSPLAPGGTIDYVVIAWTGNSASFDAALAASALVGVSAKFTSATGNPTTIPPGTAVPLADTFSGMTFPAIIPEPTDLALAGLGAATLLALRRRK